MVRQNVTTGNLRMADVCQLTRLPARLQRRRGVGSVCGTSQKDGFACAFMALTAPEHRHEAGEGNPSPLRERNHEMGVTGATDTVTNANPPARNPDTVSPKDVKDFNAAVDRSTTSNDRSKQSQ